MPEDNKNPQDNSAPINPFASEEDNMANASDSAPVNPFESDAQAEEKAFTNEGKAESQVEEQPPNPFAADSTPTEPAETSKEDIVEAEPVESEVIDNNVEPVLNADSAEGISNNEPQSTEEFSEDFWDILENAGITKGRIVAFVVILVLFFVGAYFLFRFLGSDDGGNLPDDNNVEVEDGDLDSTINIGSGANQGISQASAEEFLAAFLVGNDEELQEENFVYYTEILRDMQNIFDTDVYALLDRNVDRRLALSEHLEELFDLIEEGRRIVLQLDNELNLMEREFELTATQRDLYEDQFFINMDELQGLAAKQNLKFFKDFAQNAVELKADYNAKLLLFEMFDNSLTFLEPRYQDISVNFEALVKGVRVFDFPNSDIDAIIYLEPNR